MRESNSNYFFVCLGFLGVSDILEGKKRSKLKFV